VLPVTVPPLRERREDIVALAEHFFHLYASEKAPRLKGFSDRAIAAILDHDWPGNVRELINRVRRAMVMSDGRLITPEDLGLTRGIPAPTPAGWTTPASRSERTALRDCLDRSGHNVSRAARDLGVSRTTMYRLLSKHGIPAPSRACYKRSAAAGTAPRVLSHPRDEQRPPIRGGLANGAAQP
jgi:DNA-binding NtrC family response regulator